MIKSILTALLVIVTGFAMAQTAPKTPKSKTETVKTVTPPPPTANPQNDTVYVKLHKNQLATLQQVVAFSIQWLSKSKAPATDVSDVSDAIKALWPALVADTTIKKPKPVIKTSN